MFRRFRTTLPAVALSAVLALGAFGASTTQAQADSRDAARVIGGVIALYALSRALDNRNQGQQPSQHRFNPNRPQHYTPPHQPVRVAPANCYREFQTRHGYFRGYAGHCLQRTVHHGLPDACAQQFRTNHGPRVFYGSHCMAQNGWVQEVRHRH